MLETVIIRKLLRVPAPTGGAGDGAVVAGQLDAALLRVGFTLSGELLAHLSGLHPVVLKDVAERILGAVRGLVGDHVEHNAYFKDFPANVPDTLTFWVTCIRDALGDSRSSAIVARQLSAGAVNLLDLPKYGRYQHTYAELLAAHDELISSAKDRITVLHLGGTLTEEARALYLSLAASRVPLAEDDLTLLAELAQLHLDGEQPAAIPIRENRAVINGVRLAHLTPPLVDTVTDVLRLACAASGGDVTLEEPTRLRSLRRSERKLLLEALNAVVEASPAKLGDIGRYREPWKRLGERLHPHEYPHLPHARDVFAVARKEKTAHSLAAKVELALGAGDLDRAVSLLATAPGMLLRNLDRLLRMSAPPEALLDTVRTVIGAVSGRVLLSVREHLQNRTEPAAARIFANRKSRAWVSADTRVPLTHDVVAALCELLDEELLRRVPAYDRLVVDPAVLPIAIPLSDKAKPGGFGVMPRGSAVLVDGAALRFFVHWKEKASRTDFDLSALLLGDDFTAAGWLSYTSLTGYGGVHSGDITSAPDGASEFIDLDLSKVDARHIVPQVNIYSGEGFEVVEESFFGFMLRDPKQKGRPFEARTVRMKSDLRGAGRVALPLIFSRDDKHRWTARWLHLYLTGGPNFNRVEENRVSTSLLARGILERRYLTVSYVVELLRRKAGAYELYTPGQELTEPVTYIGLEHPEGLPAGSESYPLARLIELVPA